MDIMKFIFIGIYLIIAIVLTVLSLIQTKQDKGASTAVMGAGKDSFYEKNKSRTDEAKMDFAILVLAVIFVLATFGLYFI